MTDAPSVMRLLADENIEREVVLLLGSLGHDVKWMVTEASGTADADIPAIGRKESRVIVSYDVEFISALRRSGQTHTGAILVRAGHSDFHWIAKAIHEALMGRKNWSGRIAVIKPSGIRYVPQE
jgi:predicted nuclease of predicted toxin-antitoxin system